MGILKIVEYWSKSSQKDFTVAEGLFGLGHYSHCLFFCHLSLEKLLKAIFVHQQQTQAPYIHDLVILAKKAGIEFTHEQRLQLEVITTFNIEGRYANVKSDFYKQYNRKSTAEAYLQSTKQLRVWLKTYLKKK